MSVTSDDTPKKSKAKKGDRNDPARFVDPGLSYRGKLIGVEDVQEPRGDKVCQVAMAKLKAAVKTIGDHKQKIVINVSLDGIKIIDEKTEALVYFHPVHRISFISRDANDSRAFGYVFGAGGGSHQFYGIKTEKVAEGIVLCLRDLFQVVFEMKKQGNVSSRRSHDIDDRAPESHSFSSPKPASSRGAWLKSDHYSQSMCVPASSPSHLSTESSRSSATPVNVKRGVAGVVRQSPVPPSHPGSLPKQGLSHLSHEISRTSTTPEPIYQNASVLTERFHGPMQSAVTCSTPPVRSSDQYVCFFTPEKLEAPARKHLPGSATEWVSFEFDAAGKSTESVSESKPSTKKKDPFANDPFFSKTSGSEESGEVVIPSHVEVNAKTDAGVEPIYGFFVEPDAFADFSGFDNKSADCSAAWIPMRKGCEVDFKENAPASASICHEGESDGVTRSVTETSSDVVSFPSPDAPPPPLPQNAPLLLDYQAPVPPPRPGSSCSKSAPFTTPGHSVDRWVNSVPPALPSRPSAPDSPRFGASEVPPPPPPRSDLASSVSPTPWKAIAPRVDCTPDPFAVTLLKRSPDATITPTSIRSALKHVSSGPRDFPSPIPPRKASPLEDSTTTLCEDDNHPPMSPSPHDGAGEFHDPFASLDPFAAKEFPHDPFASVFEVLSSGSVTFSSDPSGKRFSTDDSQSLNNPGAAATDSLSDDVFSSRDEPDEKTEDSLRSPTSEHQSNGERDRVPPQRTNDKSLGSFIASTETAASRGSTNVHTINFPVDFSNHRPTADSFESRSESTFDAQSSFDNVMDDFSRRFPPFDDSWSMPPLENLFRQSCDDAHPADSLQPTGGDATAGKSRLSIPMSSDSSANSELAEAFGNDGISSASRGVMKS